MQPGRGSRQNDLAAVTAFEHAYEQRARRVISDRHVAEIAMSAGAATTEWSLSGWWSDPAERGSMSTVRLPNPWDDRAGVRVMERHCWAVAQCIIQKLGTRLNALHGVRHSPRYWEFLLAPWALHVTSALADRQLFVRTAHALAPEAPLAAHAPPAVPRDMSDALALLATSDWNAAVIGLLARNEGVEVRTSAASADAAGPMPEARETARVKPTVGDGLLVAKRALVSGLLRLGGTPAVTVVGISGMTPGESLRLARRVRGLRVPIARARSIDVPAADDALREGLAFAAEGSSTLERTVTVLLSDLVPRTLVEGFAAVRDYSARAYGAATPTLACNYAADDVQNEYLARCVSEHHQVEFAQHGGFYLQADVNGQERLEVRPDSRFWSWGVSSARGTFTVPNPRLERLRESHQGGTLITLIEGLHPPDTFLVRFASTPLGDQTFESACALAQLVESVASPVRSRMRLKRFPPVRGHAPRPPALDALDHHGPNAAHAATDWMQRSSLVVVGYPDTPFVESMVIGAPTIGLWNPSHWEWRPELDALLAELRECHIVFHDPAAAAEHLDRVAQNPREWWDAPGTVEARRYALRALAAEGNWLEAWSAGLKRLARGDTSHPAGT